MKSQDASSKDKDGSPSSPEGSRSRKAPPPLPVGGESAGGFSRKDLMLGRHKRKKKGGAPPPIAPRHLPPESEIAPDSPESAEFPDLNVDAPSAPAGDGARKGDLGQTIRDRSRTVKSTDLAQHHSEVRVLNMSTIMSLVEDAVAEALQSAEHSWDDVQRQRLLEEAEEAFQERLDSFQAEKAGLEAQAQNLEQQLERAQDLLEDERSRVVSADQFTVSDQGMVELERRLSRLIDRAVKRSEVGPDIEDDMRNVVSKLLDDEREKIKKHAEEAQSDKIKLLERKIGRLSSTLDETEQARRSAENRAHALESAQGGMGLKNVVEAGLDGDDPYKEKKLELLKEIIDGNKAVRDFMKDKPRYTKSPARPAVKAAAPPGESPVEDAPAVGEEGSVVDALEAPDSGTPEPAAISTEDGDDTVEIGGFREEIQVSDSRGIKSISVARVAPPPLEKKKKPRDEVEGEPGEMDAATLEFMQTLDGGGSGEIDPDDLTWEPPS